MNTNTKLQHIDLWEAWVEVEQFNHTTTATLYLIGEISVNNTILEPRFEKLPSEPGKENRLLLQIVPNILCEEGIETEILYSEQLQLPEQYTGITIFSGDEILVEIEELEFLYA